MSSIRQSLPVWLAPGGSGSGEARRVVHVLIEGRVQGVGYRAWTERTAISLALSGWVRNCRNGAVEAVFAGNSDAIERMVRMVRHCWCGPPAASVAAVQVNHIEADPGQGFAVRSTG